MSDSLWTRANIELVAKSLAELLYEEILEAKEESNLFHVTLKSDVAYTFAGVRGKWDFLQIDPSSIKRLPNNGIIDASTFFQDANLDMGMSSITLTHFLEEMNNTLFSEMKILQNKSQLPTEQLAKLSGEALTPYLSGHPKILLNKGRIGLSADALRMYAPEHAPSFQVFWLAIKKDFLIESSLQQTECFFSQNVLNQDDLEKIKELLSLQGESLKNYSIIPVHPWQFDRYIETQYQKAIAEKKIIPLTCLGDLYTPQISIRTIANVKNKKSCDLKLSMTILNTSAYRGISGENITTGPILSDYIENLCHSDELLKKLNIKVLKELYVASVAHSAFSKIKDAPYRYNELLGCVARESAASKIESSELAIMTGSLFYVGDDHKCLIGEYISLSKTTAKKWMQAYFKHVVIPLYHLQLNYGIGIVSHGQNIVLRLNNYVPNGVFIKDFQGDLRVNKYFIHKLPTALQTLKALPADYLIHDLITGHFVTVLRFISPILEKFELLNEADFYKILRLEIADYLQTHHPGLELSNPLNLLRPEFEKVILNKVRFNIGYEDSAARPLPLLGKNLMNPISGQQKDSYEL